MLLLQLKNMSLIIAVIEVEENVFLRTEENNLFINGHTLENETPNESLNRILSYNGIIANDNFIIDEFENDKGNVKVYYLCDISFEKNMPQFITRDEIISFEENIDIINRILRHRDNYINNLSIIKAYKSETLLEFMKELYPVNWGGICARIIETGVSFTEEDEPWLIGVSDIQKTVRKGNTYVESILKSVLFMAHDTFHNLWGLPYIKDFDLNNQEFFMKAQMCGEIAVLTVTEFILAKQIKKRHKELGSLIDKRNAVPMMNYGEELYHLSPRDLATRLESILKDGKYQKWIYNTDTGMNFFNDYIPMLQKDIRNILQNWDTMKRYNFIPNALCNNRYNSNMSSSELTQWMLDDFMHQRNSDGNIDYELSEFNRNRRKRMVVPTEWIY